MRMRKKKNGAARLAACADLQIQSRLDLPSLPIHLEIGCGKGAFICGMAQRHPEVQYLAVEKYSDVAVLAMEKVKSLGLPNVRFWIGDAKGLLELLQKGDVSHLYLNFSDPWPKKGHAKRRLTHRNFLALYESLLIDGGAIEFKTDNRPLFDFSLEEMTEYGLALSEVCYDLHASEFQAQNIETEYEKNFSQKGFPINRVVAYFEKS